MPRATRQRSQKAAPVVEEPEDVEEEQEEAEVDGQQEYEGGDEIEVDDETSPLQFDEAITWRAGRPIPVNDLLRRLTAFYQELSRMDQIPEGDPSRARVIPKAQELANAQLMGHRDKGVKAWTMACISQMIRVTAPDAPYKPSQLKEYFMALATNIIPALASPSDPYARQYMDVLNAVSTFRSVVLVCDLPGAENVIITLLANSFDLLSGNIKGGTGEILPKSLEYHLTNIMSIILEERGSLPDGAIDILLAQFIRADPDTWAKSGKEPPKTLNDISPAYNVARGVCIAGADILRGAIGKYFSSVLIDASEASTFSSKPSKNRGRKRTHDESEDELDDGMLTPPTETDFHEVEKAHRLLRELWRSAPDVIEDTVPQMEPEIKAENVELRTLAVQTIGDMVAGVGAAGPPPPMALNPAVYPSQSVEPDTNERPANALYTPMAHHDFAIKYPDCYHEFLSRRNDRSPQVRSAWVTAAGRILLTSGGGRGLDADQEATLLRSFKDMLLDHDEKVRLAAVHAVSLFDFAAICERLSSLGGVDVQGSLLQVLADRLRDPKPNVHAAATELLAKVWGVASGAIAEGSDRIRTLFGGIPSKILHTVYVQRPDITALVQSVLYDSLLPISYPVVRPPRVDENTQLVADSQNTPPDPDFLRIERILVLVRDLDDKAKVAFFSLQQNQKTRAQWMNKYLTAAEALNADEPDANQNTNRQMLAKSIEVLATSLRDPVLATEHLKLYAKNMDKRLTQLIRFCWNSEKDYRVIINAHKEFVKRIKKEMPSALQPVLETIPQLMRNVSLLVYNRSHVKAITAFSRSNEKDLGEAANELLQKISSQNPDAFKAYAKQYCQTLKSQAPTESSKPDQTVVDTLKACADFAIRSPDDMPNDRDFSQAMVAFALHGTPPKAAKHAVSIIAASAGKKEMYIREITKKSTEGFEYGQPGFLSKLAGLSQTCLLRAEDVDADSAEEITKIALGKILSQSRTPASDSDPDWKDELDDDLLSKIWALKLVVNGLRGRTRLANTEDAKIALQKAAHPVYRLLNTAIENDGELLPASDGSTPAHYKAQIRLTAAIHLLKMSCTRSLDVQFTHADFNRLAKITQDPLSQVRSGFAKVLKKYLGQAKLPPRFYGLIFLYAFEPVKSEKEPTTNWLRARAAAANKANDTTMILTFCRFLSLLAHHQDFSSDPDELQDFVKYILFFLSTVATQDTLPLIYSQAQRLKTVQDGIDSLKSENLYILSDLAQAVILRFQEEKGWSLQIHAGVPRLPGGVFAALSDSSTKRDISEKQFLPEEIVDSIEDLVKLSLKPKSKKRKADGNGKSAAKKPKVASATAGAKKPAARKTAAKTAKTPKKPVADAAPSSERRKSTRRSTATNYAEQSSDEDDEELEQNNHGDDDEGDDNVDSSPPPTSEPARATRQPPRPTNGQSAAARERDNMRIPSDDNEELSDAPSDLDV